VGLVNYAREQAELQTREYGVIFHDDGYQFVAYDARRGVWREVYEDDALRLRKLPDGLDFKLLVDARPVTIVPTGEVKPAAPSTQPKTKALKDINTLGDATQAATAQGATTARGTPLTTQGGSSRDSKATLDDQKPILPQVMIFSNGDLSSFEITVERDQGLRSVTLALDEKGQVVARPMVEHKA
jgi:hypothetical protein